MRSAAPHLDPHHEHALRLNADVEVGRLPRDREVAAPALRDRPVGAAVVDLLGFLVGDDHQPHGHPVLTLQVLQRAHHRGQAALHVVGAAPDQAVPLDPRLELLGTPGHDIEMTVEDDTRRGWVGARAARRPRGSADFGDQHGLAAVVMLDDLDVARLEPAADEPGGGAQLIWTGGVVADQPLRQGLLVDHHKRG